MSPFEKNVNNGRYILAKKHTITQAGAYLKRIKYIPETGFFAAAYSNGKFSISKLLGEELH